MTVIVGIVGDDDVYIGADSGITIGDQSIVTGKAKIAAGTVRLRAKAGKMPIIVAGAGDWRLWQVVLRASAEQSDRECDNVDEWLETVFVDNVRGSVASERRAGRTGISDDDIDILVAMDGRLFIVPGSGGIIEVDRCAAIGSGGQVALGALDALGLDPRYAGKPQDTIRASMMVAARHISGIREPFNIARLKG